MYPFSSSSGQVPQGHSGQLPRYLELLEMVRGEFEHLSKEATFGRMGSEENELKCTPFVMNSNNVLVQSQLMDINSMKKAIYELERLQIRKNKQYEDEIARLKHQLSISTGEESGVASMKFPSIPNLESELSVFAASFSRFTDNLVSKPTQIPQYPSQAQTQYQGRTMYSSSQTQGTKRPKDMMGEEDQASRNVRSREKAPEQQIMLSSGPPIKEKSAGFDWLVVYNPKANRSITIDLLHTLSHDDVVCCVKFSHSGKWLATGSNRRVAIYDVLDGKCLASFQDFGSSEDKSEKIAVEQYVRSIAFSPDDKYLVTGSEDKVVRVWNVDKSEIIFRLDGHDQDIYSIDFLPNGNDIVSASGDRTIRIWDLKSGECKHVLSAEESSENESGFTSVSVSPNGKYVAAGSLDKTIRIWDTMDNRLILTLQGHQDAVYSVYFGHDGKYLVSGSLDKTIKIWQFDSSIELSRGTCRYTILGHKDYVLSVVATPVDGRWIISSSKDRSVQFWDSTSGTTQLMLQGHRNSVINVAVSPKGNMFATASGDSRTRIWTFSKYTKNFSSAENHKRRENALSTGKNSNSDSAPKQSPPPLPPTIEATSNGVNKDEQI